MFCTEASFSTFCGRPSPTKLLPPLLFLPPPLPFLLPSSASPRPSFYALLLSPPSLSLDLLPSLTISPFSLPADLLRSKLGEAMGEGLGM